MKIENSSWWRSSPEPERLGEAASLRFCRGAITLEPWPPTASQQLREALELPARYYHRPAVPSVTWPYRFHAYQHDGIDTLLARESLLLADDMGLGKTVQAVAALRILFRQRRIERALIVAPSAVLSQWRGTFMDWAPELRTSTIEGHDRAWQWRAAAHVFLVSYDTLREDFTENPASPPRRYVWDVVILDEAQRIKNRDVEISRICKRLPRRRAWAVTGTPLENRLDDLASVCEFVTPWWNNQPQLRLVPGVELLERHATIQLRRKKSAVAHQLPPKTVIDVPVTLSNGQRTTYERAERDGVIWLRQLGRNVQVQHVLELIMRLKQICNVCPRTGESAKLDDLVDRIETIVGEGNKALVFTQFIDDIHGARAIARHLRHLQPRVYTGGMTPDERRYVLRTFRNETQGALLVLSLRAGGVGLNLQDAAYVVHFDRWWNPAVEGQAEDRVHRLGQERPVTVYRYICQGTLEERIDALLRTKRELFDLIIDDVSLDLGTTLNRAELLGLFGMNEP